ncbi:Hypothetical protein GLP15_1164 [Giardia lamblia P15]|uniref:Prefoldin subunit n=1 Tax=Giardia intestinalis (strain P15) TaxID=658858 RepID=E1F4P8_GIAIA|nr:Hypothetical protein GLP15_1164 [Giardia lamblia P15]
MTPRAADALAAVRSELCNLQRYMSIRKRGEPRPYVRLGNVALIPVKQPGQEAPLVVHLGCGIFVERSDCAVKERVESVLDSIKSQEDKLDENLRDNPQNLEEGSSACATVPPVLQQKARTPEASVRYELPPFVFENDPHAVVMEHKVTVQKRPKPRRLRSQFAIERL